MFSVQHCPMRGDCPPRSLPPETEVQRGPLVKTGPPETMLLVCYQWISYLKLTRIIFAWWRIGCSNDGSRAQVLKPRKQYSKRTRYTIACPFWILFSWFQYLRPSVAIVPSVSFMFNPSMIDVVYPLWISLIYKWFYCWGSYSMRAQHGKKDICSRHYFFMLMI